jgi:hypothetical protein
MYDLRLHVYLFLCVRIVNLAKIHTVENLKILNSHKKAICVKINTPAPYQSFIYTISDMEKKKRLSVSFIIYNS